MLGEDGSQPDAQGLAELTIGLELRLVEELVARGLLREGRVPFGELTHDERRLRDEAGLVDGETIRVDGTRGYVERLERVRYPLVGPWWFGRFGQQKCAESIRRVR